MNKLILIALLLASFSANAEWLYMSVLWNKDNQACHINSYSEFETYISQKTRKYPEQSPLLNVDAGEVVTKVYNYTGTWNVKDTFDGLFTVNNDPCVIFNGDVTPARRTLDGFPHVAGFASKNIHQSLAVSRENRPPVYVIDTDGFRREYTLLEHRDYVLDGVRLPIIDSGFDGAFNENINGSIHGSEMIANVLAVAPLGTKIYPISYNNETFSDSLAFALKEAINHKKENYPDEWAVVSLSVSELFGDSRLFNEYVNRALLEKIIVVRSQGTNVQKLMLSEEGLRRPMALFAIKVGHHTVLSDGKVIPLAPQGADFSLPDLMDYVYPNSSGGYSEVGPGPGGSSVNTALVAGLVETMINDNPYFNQADGLNGWMLIKDALARASTQIKQEDLVVPEQTYRLSLHGEINFEEAIDRFKEAIDSIKPKYADLVGSGMHIIDSCIPAINGGVNNYSPYTLQQFFDMLQSMSGCEVQYIEVTKYPNQNNKIEMKPVFLSHGTLGWWNVNLDSLAELNQSTIEDFIYLNPNVIVNYYTSNLQ